MLSSSITLLVSSPKRAVFINVLKNLCSYGKHFSPGIPLNLSVRLFGILCCFVRELLRIIRSFHYLKPSSAFPSHSEIPMPNVNSWPWPIPSWHPHHLPDPDTYCLLTLCSAGLLAVLQSHQTYSTSRVLYFLSSWSEILLTPKYQYALPLHFLQDFFLLSGLPWYPYLKWNTHRPSVHSQVPQLCFVSLHGTHHQLIYFIFIYWFSPPLQP